MSKKKKKHLEKIWRSRREIFFVSDVFMFSRVKSRSHLHVVTCTKWQRWCKSHWDFCSSAAAVRWQNRPPLLSFETRSSLRVFVTETALHPAQRSQVGTATNNKKKKEKQKHVYRYKFTALNFGVGVSSCGRNFFFFFFNGGKWKQKALGVALRERRSDAKGAR